MMMRASRELARMAAWSAMGAGLALVTLPAQAAEPATTTKRPKICLVLSGGGARGAAHVGVLKVLEELWG